MSDTMYYIVLTAVVAGVTVLLRAFPFILFGSGRKPPAVIGYLGKVVSPAAIAMLVVYCLADYLTKRGNSQHGYGIAEIAACLVVIGLHLWRKNPLLSIIAGTAVYMILVQLVFP